MYIKPLVILFLALSFNSIAQEFKLGKVSIEELQEKVHPLDSTAPAAILFRTGKTYFVWESSLVMVTEVDTRIKIYTDEGYKYATDELIYYVGGKKVKANYSKACTYNLNEGEIEKTKLKSEGKFRDNITKNYASKKITLPAVKKGSVIEYRYTIKTPYFTAFKDWYFQYDIPANQISYDVAIPSYLSYNRNLCGYIPVNQSEPKKQNGYTGYDDIAITYSVKNVGALKEEPFIDNVYNYRATLKHELAYTLLPGEQTKHYSTTWSDVAKEIYRDDDFGRQLNKISYFEDDIAILLKGINTPNEKLQVIFDYVKKRMNWNGNNRYYCEDGVKRAYQNKVGNAAEINLMLTSMLRYAGLNANPVLVSTRSNGAVFYPNRTGFNYVITVVTINNETLLLDATSKYTVPGILPERAINWVGRLINIDGTNEEINLFPTKKSLTAITLVANIVADGSISGELNQTHFDFSAYNFRNDYTNINQEQLIANFEEQYNNITISDFQLSNIDDLEEPVKSHYFFKTNNEVELIGDKIYFSPLLFLAKNENPFKQEKRQYPIDFVFPNQVKIMILINLPKGYEVESMPEPLNMKMEKNIGRFKYSIVSNKSQLQIMTDYSINQSNLSQYYYDTLKNFYSEMIKKQNEKIVLKKT